MIGLNANNWLQEKLQQTTHKKEFIEGLIEEREELHKKQIECLLFEEVKLDNQLLKITQRRFCYPVDTSRANSIYQALDKIAEQRREVELELWKEKMQLRLMLEEIILEEQSKTKLAKWK
ncbi:hypothetical protein COV18_02670 [Candidatus Woesearchaeota archaeon CG10_big_fil_rev_8_21_14_0_10_37_12]|nr:MAG: hypothetical protein COV18_02670 [Candidatus Woesearchaeota archaeon CG10_big_fil_rev_8_21_14_0_10_37_12]